MAKKSLAGLLGNVDTPPVTEAAPKVAATAPPREAPAPPARKATAAVPAPGESAVAKATRRPRTSGASATPKFLQLERKEARFTSKQLDELTQLRRRINRASPPGAGERVTENTLIRIAVDLLLERGHELNGSDENELRKSVGL